MLKVSSFVLPRLNISSDLSLKLEPRPRLCLHKVEQRLNREGGGIWLVGRELLEELLEAAGLFLLSWLKKKLKNPAF